MGIGALQPVHLLLILAIVLVVFGAGKLGQVGGALGQSIKEFKSNVTDPEEEARKEAAEAAAKAQADAAAKIEAAKVTTMAAQTPPAPIVEPVVAATVATPAAPKAEAPALRREEI